MKLTAKQLFALQDAKSKGGWIFQLSENRRHSPVVLASLVKKGMLEVSKSEVYWSITTLGDAALSSQNEREV